MFDYYYLQCDKCHPYGTTKYEDSIHRIERGTKFYTCECGYVYKVDPNAEVCFYIHPSTLDHLYEAEAAASFGRRINSPIDEAIKLAGFLVKIDYKLDPTVKPGSWIFRGKNGRKKEPFIEYEKSDEDWCRYCGFGFEAKVNTLGGVKFDGIQLEDQGRIVEYMKYMLGDTNERNS